MAFFARLKQLGNGTKRLLVTLSLAASALAGISSLAWAYHIWFQVERSAETVLIIIGVCLAAFLGPFILIWLGTRLVLWIVDGFGQSGRRVVEESGLEGEPVEALEQPAAAPVTGSTATGGAGITVLRVVIWIVLGAAFLRGLKVFDAGGSFGLDGVGAGLCFSTAVLGTILMFCFDVLRKR